MATDKSLMQTACHYGVPRLGRVGAGLGCGQHSWVFLTCCAVANLERDLCQGGRCPGRGQLVAHGPDRAGEMAGVNSELLPVAARLQQS